ncbi:MAG: metallophosphoesterase family protein [Candidatus Acidiferrales bacterium]
MNRQPGPVTMEAQRPRSPILLLAALLVFVSCAAPPRLAPPEPATAPPPGITLPKNDGSVRFAIIGDSGTGGHQQYEVARQMAAAHAVFPFEFVLMMGDNLYGDEDPEDYARKFEQPYKPLLDAGVKFYASLGNHDEPDQRFYQHFNMGGERYYTFEKNGVRFFALDSTYMDEKQLAWLEKELAQSDSKWKICFFHHPPYSSGRRHGSDEELRAVLEPLFVKYGVNAVFSGHEHFYERIKPQKGIYYFIAGASGKLRRRNIRASQITARGFDTDYTFMVIEVDGDLMHFQTLTRSGEIVDRGALKHNDVAGGAENN